jgi:hypothetical protein
MLMTAKLIDLKISELTCSHIGEWSSFDSPQLFSIMIQKQQKYYQQTIVSGNLYGLLLYAREDENYFEFHLFLYQQFYAFTGSLLCSARTCSGLLFLEVSDNCVAEER